MQDGIFELTKIFELFEKILVGSIEAFKVEYNHYFKSLAPVKRILIYYFGGIPLIN